MKIGIISDTHGLLREEALRHLAGVAMILHAGDIGDPAIIERLEAVAPTTAIRGNNDTGAWARELPETRPLAAGRRTIYLLHDLKKLNVDPVHEGFDVVVSGHSHKPKIETRDGVLYLNPGSAGPRRFRLPITLALIEIDDHGIEPKILDITHA